MGSEWGRNGQILVSVRGDPVQSRSSATAFHWGRQGKPAVNDPHGKLRKVLRIDQKDLNQDFGDCNAAFAQQVHKTVRNNDVFTGNPASFTVKTLEI